MVDRSGELQMLLDASGFHVPMADGEEAKLVERLKRQDEAAFNEVVRLYQNQVYQHVRRMLQDDAEAEDVAQEVFVTVFKKIGSFRAESKLSTWIYRVATNHCLNRIKYLKRRGRDRKRQFDEFADRGQIESATMDNASRLPRPDDLAEGKQLEQLIKLAIGELPEDQRTLIVLRELENLSYDEIQEITGLAQGTVKSRLHRARLALHKRVLELQGGEE